MDDLRKKEIKITVKETESCLDAIKRYMKRKGYEYGERNKRGDYTGKYWINEHFDIWLFGMNYSETTKKVTFELDGNSF